MIQYDTSQSIQSTKGVKGEHLERNKQLLDILFSNQAQIDPSLKQVEKVYKGLGNKGFDVISCQFSFHYYCKSEESLRGYLQGQKVTAQ